MGCAGGGGGCFVGWCSAFIALYVLWHTHQVRYVSACGALPLGVSWCTVCKGTPQDLMDHVRGAHNVPGEIKKVRLETLFPPQTVTCQVYTDSLTSRHSGISNGVLLFSDIGLSLIHHYRVHKRGLPHVTFCRNSITSPYYEICCAYA